MSKRYIISGGGTGGHIFPAIAIANAIKKLEPSAEILFVGANGRMEMQKVPTAGFNIVGLPIAGIQRSLSLKNLSFPFKLLKSILKARKTVKDFKPNVVIGVGGYASGPTLWMASLMGIPTFIQEQNSYAGLTNKLLAKKAKKIFVAYEGMEKYFPKEKLVMTGNPVRQDLENSTVKRDEAIKYFGLDSNKKVILCIGGSLGARTLNQSIFQHLETIEKSDIQLVWQCGSYYHNMAKEQLNSYKGSNIKLYDFISRMDLAYSVADVVISRAGASSISELCIVAKPAILVPSPNVAEDHQTKNALALVNKDAAIMVKDQQAKEILINEALKLSNDRSLCSILSANISKLALRSSAESIAKQIL